MSKESHSFSIEVACKVGIPTAIIIQHLVYLHKVCMGNGENRKGNRFWISKSIKAMSIVYPYLTPKEIRGCVDRLEKDGYILSAKMSENRFDRTKWYSIEEKGFDLLSIPQNMRQNSVFDTTAAFDERANASSQKGDSQVPKRANEKFPKGQMNTKVYCNSCSYSNTLTLSGESECANGGTDELTNGGAGSLTPQSPPLQNETAEPGYTFEVFWADYGFKTGSKKNARAKWDKLKPSEIEAIRATLERYKRDTVTEDAGRNGAAWKKMRKQPEFYLSGKMWEAYAAADCEAANEPPSEYDEHYQKYIGWVRARFPKVAQSVAYLSKRQYIAHRTENYVKGMDYIGQDSLRNLLTRAHEEVEAGASKLDVFAHNIELIEQRLKARQV